MKRENVRMREEKEKKMGEDEEEEEQQRMKDDIDDDEEVDLFGNSLGLDDDELVQRLLEMYTNMHSSFEGWSEEGWSEALDFSSEERALYDSAKSDTLSCISGTVEDHESGLNALQALDRLRLLYNHGTLYHGRHTRYQPRQHDRSQWQQSDAQDAHNAMVMAGSAVCFACKADVGSSSAEIADQVVGAAVRPILSRCMQLITVPVRSTWAGNVLLAATSLPTPSTKFARYLRTCRRHLRRTDRWRRCLHSTKIQALLRDVREHAPREKCVVFSFWTTTLDVIQTGLQQLDLAFVRFDGNVRAKDKAKGLDAFAADPAMRIVLLTISFGAVGLDLTAASRAYLMEPHWNPSVEEQALARIYRIGQRRPATTVRYIMRTTLKEHVLKV
ncbi:hypothetical protein KC354_g13067 [Hortaea werneckii]|nr:hypothetical protein KC354_g13067 [Hortaea werneckii]